MKIPILELTPGDVTFYCNGTLELAINALARDGLLDADQAAWANRTYTANAAYPSWMTRTFRKIFMKENAGNHLYVTVTRTPGPAYRKPILEEANDDDVKEIEAEDEIKN